jgi:hypothetical protein
MKEGGHCFHISAPGVTYVCHTAADGAEHWSLASGRRKGEACGRARLCGLRERECGVLGR